LIKNSNEVSPVVAAFDQTDVCLQKLSQFGRPVKPH